MDSIPDSGKLLARLSHPCFPQPIDGNILVWRYVNLAKFISHLVSKSLALTRLDLFDDPYEGSQTAKTVAGIDAFLKNMSGPNSGYHELGKLVRANRSCTYVSCWHINEHESEAMWRLYAGAGGGVALQTTYKKLVESIEEQYGTYIGVVRYIDYSVASFPDANLFWPVMHKRASFSHEREVRLVRHIGSPVNQEESSPQILEMPWSIEKYVDNIFVEPYAHQYYYDAVHAVLASMSPGLLPKLRWSQMRNEPIF